MTRDTLATIAGMVVAICSTFQTMMPPDTPWWARATLAALAAALGMWTGTAAYRPTPVQMGKLPVLSGEVVSTDNRQLTTPNCSLTTDNCQPEQKGF